MFFKVFIDNAIVYILFGCECWLLAQCGHPTDALLLSGAFTNLSKWTGNSAPFDVVSVLVYPKLPRVACLIDILYCHDNLFGLLTETVTVTS